MWLPELSENGEAGDSGHAVGDGSRLVEHNWTFSNQSVRKPYKMQRQTDR